MVWEDGEGDLSSYPIILNVGPRLFRDLDPRNFTSMTRLDHNRAIGQTAIKLSQPVRDIKKMVVWGNHSGTQYPISRMR